MRTPPAPRLLALALALALELVLAPAQADEPARLAALQSVVVVGTTVLPGVGTPLSQVPANVQTLRADALAAPRAATLAQALDQGIGSVNVNDTAGNPYQLDVNFRGFTASPALGTPQGLSVFVDGVRINEAFGDTVNWDLIPAGAIARLSVIPGSNPVFGLNTLGGALSVVTRDVFDEDGGQVRATAGAWRREALEAEAGGHDAHVGWFATANALHERGWGMHDPSRVAQAFGKLGWRDGADRADLSVSLANTRLEGNQTLPLSWLADARQSYSWPDHQANRLAFLNANASHRFAPTLLLEGNAFHRALRSVVLNSNVNDDFDTREAVGPGNEPTGNAIDDIRQARSGASLQLTSTATIAGHANHLGVGASVESGFTRFTQSSQEAGSSRDTTSSAPVSLQTALHARASDVGLHATDTFGLDARNFLVVSGRYDVARVVLADQRGTALNGHHVFRRLNPAIGLTSNPRPELTFYATYNEGMRVPTPVELTCADPAAPCALPNAFASDPALKPVISRNTELGARGRSAALEWSFALFHTGLRDDIQFVSSGSGATSAGYFQNVGATRRQGLELGLQSHGAALSLALRYSVVDATFRTPLVLNSPNNSTAGPISCAQCADIAVHPGNRLPGIARHTFKVRGAWSFGDAADVGATLVAQSGTSARGDENNADANGRLPGFALVNLDARVHLGAAWEAFANVDNLFDRRTSSFGTLGRNVFTGPGRTFDATGASWRSEQFRVAGAPRGIWVGLVWRFGAQAADAP
ncbi:MAG: TonB-dependent receptor [Burkholderiales bacterium]|nr:TonB-dependent receptor [Burkholderiales bacterium]